MSNISDKNIDRIFKEAGSRADYPFDQDAWASLNERLVSPDAPTLGYYKSMSFILLALLAAIVTIFITADQPETKNSLVAVQSVEESLDDRLSEMNGRSYESHTHIAPEALTSNQKYTDDGLESNYEAVNNSNGIPKQVALSNNKKVNSLNKKHPNTDYPQPDLHEIPVTGHTSATLEKGEKAKKSLSQVAVKLSLAPDFSSIGYYSPKRSGFNVGVFLEYHLSDRWWIFTGAMLSKKHYSGNDKKLDYGLNEEAKLENASCRVVDIPLNAGYYLYSGEKSNFYVTAGLSSYFMLSESYSFTSIDYYGSSETWNQNYKNENDHLFGVVNFSFGFERKLNQNISLQAEPFMKSPITDIGEGKVNLVSGGVMINFKYQFNRIQK